MKEEILNRCGNSTDIIIRTINLKNNVIDCIYSETLSSSSAITNYVLKPISELIIENKNIANTTIINLIKNLLTGSSINELKSIDEAIKNIFLGYTIIIINNKNILSIETKAQS